MCRLLGYATAGFNLSLNAVLGQDNVEDFRELSEIHNDGWGVAQLSDPAEAPHVRDGGAPTPETGTRIYKSTIAARHDSTFEALADEPSRGAIWHLRLASSNLPLIMENQHPFYANGLSFIHNGDISDANGRNIVTNRSYPVNHSVFLSTGGRSDSAIFFAVILEYIGFGFSLDEAVAQWQDKYVRLQAEFDNYRKRTLKEKMDLVQTGGRDVLLEMLPVRDDVQRAVDAMQKSDDLEALRAGVTLISQKFTEALRRKGVTEIEVLDKEFDADFSEAVARFAAGDEKKGKVIDVVQTGYMLGEKVLRFAKVVVGE